MKEAIEWTNGWCIECNDESKKRILMVGDSICHGYYDYVYETLKDEYVIDKLATSRTINSEFYKSQLLMYLKEQRYDYVTFNNGLHGFFISTEEYKDAYEEMLNLMKEQKVMIITSTPVTKKDDTSAFDEINGQVTERNNAVKELAKKHSLPVADLYEFVYGKPDIRVDDGYHYKPEGYKIIAEFLSKEIKKNF